MYIKYRIIIKKVINFNNNLKLKRSFLYLFFYLNFFKISVIIFNLTVKITAYIGVFIKFFFIKVFLLNNLIFIKKNKFTLLRIIIIT